MKEKEELRDAQGITRRGFLSGAAVAGVSLASAGVLGACAPSQTSGQSTGSAAETRASDATSTSVLNPQDYEYRSNTTDFATLFSGFDYGPIKLNHRMVKSAAGSDTWTKNGIATEMIEYYKNFARGGVEMVWVENFSNLLTQFPVPTKKDLSTYDVKALVDAVHEEGAFIGYQFDSMGATIGTTSASGQFVQATATDMTKEQITSFQNDVIAGVKRLYEAGFDAFEYNAAGNNMGQSFFSRLRNKREDEYGPQSFENRARFVTETIEGIKRECGQDFMIQVLINGIEENDANLGNSSECTTVEENAELCKLLEAAGADSIHVRLGPNGQHVCQFASDLYFTGTGIDGTTGYGNLFDFTRHWQGKLIANHSGCGMLLDVAAEIKKAITIPVGTVTYMDPAHAPDFFENALKEGKVDFLIMNRPLTVDTDYVNKLKEGRLDEIAPCTRCMHCHFDKKPDGTTYEHCRVNACTQNAYRDRMPEGYTLLPKNGEKKVMVVGAGPAGMEAARIAAQRGYAVTLYEKDGAVGGLLEFANLVKGPHENLPDLIAYLSKQLELSGVSVVTGTEVDAALIESEAPDVVVLATGGLRDTLGLTETSGTKIVALNDVLTTELGENVTVVGANAQAIDTVMYLLAQGKHVSMVFSDPIGDVAKGHSNWVKTFEMPMIYARGTRMWPQAEITSVGEGTITIKGETGVDIVIECDSVIEAMDMLPDKSLLDALSGIETYAVGDCSEPWNIASAITEGNITARNI